MNIELIERLLKIPNGTITLNDVPIEFIYDCAKTFNVEVRIINEYHSTTIKNKLITVTLSNLPF